jgi:hypothetical protein
LGAAMMLTVNVPAAPAHWTRAKLALNARNKTSRIETHVLAVKLSRCRVEDLTWGKPNTLFTYLSFASGKKPLPGHVGQLKAASS